MARNVDVIIRVGGEGGEGVISAGDIITMALARCSMEIYTFRTYPAEIKGGHAVYQVRASDDLLLSQGDGVDVLVAFNQEAYDRHASQLKPPGIIVYDTDAFELPAEFKGIRYGAPIATITREQVGSNLTKNIVFVGVVAQLFGIPLDRFEDLLKERYGKKGPEAMEKNLLALNAGAAYVREHLTKQDAIRIVPRERGPRMVVSGNEALSLGAIAAGLKIYAGYPITPASDIMEWLAKELPKFGGSVIQTEDEIAAIGVVLGASFAGKKAMTATSGPGFSLMVEMLGLATMTEIPAVVVNVQRAGPSTGMPTKTEQADLGLAIYGAHGGAPRIVVALTSVEDCFYGIIRAFNFSERFQTPVIVLSDQYLGHRKASIDRPDLSQIQVEERAKPTPEELQPYHRFKITETYVSPMAIPGEMRACYTASGLEHEPSGALNYEPDNHQTMVAKRFKKLDPIKHLTGLTRRYGVERPEIAVIGWGSSEGVIREAVALAERRGLPVGALHPKVICPLPEDDIREFLKPVKRVIVPEVNYSGQFAKWLRGFFAVEVVSLAKAGGAPFSPKEVLTKIEEVAHDVRPTTIAGV